MSGGVDSSVAAALLDEQGYEVIGVTMQIWPAAQDTEKDLPRACCSLSAVEDARRVAAALGIPHYVMNFKEEFRKNVIDSLPVARLTDFTRCANHGYSGRPCSSNS